MDVLNYRLTFCVLICQAGTPFGTNCAKLWVHFHGPWIAEVPNDFCLLSVFSLSTALKLWMQVKSNSAVKIRCESALACLCADIHGRACTHCTETCARTRGWTSSLKRHKNTARVKRYGSSVVSSNTPVHTLYRKKNISKIKKATSRNIKSPEFTKVFCIEMACFAEMCHFVFRSYSNGWGKNTHTHTHTHTHTF